LTIVSIDPQRRIYLPKELHIEADKAIIIPYGANYLLIPIPREITPMDARLTLQELKKKAEEHAEKEVKDANRIRPKNS